MPVPTTNPTRSSIRRSRNVFEVLWLKTWFHPIPPVAGSTCLPHLPNASCIPFLFAYLAFHSYLAYLPDSVASQPYSLSVIRSPCKCFPLRVAQMNKLSVLLTYLDPDPLLLTLPPPTQHSGHRAAQGDLQDPPGRRQGQDLPPGAHFISSSPAQPPSPPCHLVAKPLPLPFGTGQTPTVQNHQWPNPWLPKRLVALPPGVVRPLFQYSRGPCLRRPQ